MISILKKIVLQCMMNKMQVFIHSNIAEKRALVLMHGALSNKFHYSVQLCFIYRASRLKVAVTGDVPGRVTVTSVFHVPSMLTPALKR